MRLRDNSTVNWDSLDPSWPIIIYRCACNILFCIIAEDNASMLLFFIIAADIASVFTIFKSQKKRHFLRRTQDSMPTSSPTIKYNRQCEMMLHNIRYVTKINIEGKSSVEFQFLLGHGHRYDFPEDTVRNISCYILNFTNVLHGINETIQYISKRVE